MGEIRDRFKKLAKFRSVVIICLRVKQTTEVDISTREDCRFLGVYCHHIRKPLRISLRMYIAYPSGIIHSNSTHAKTSFRVVNGLATYPLRNHTIWVNWKQQIRQPIRFSDFSKWKNLGRFIVEWKKKIAVAYPAHNIHKLWLK